jgi:hypothetical protein
VPDPKRGELFWMEKIGGPAMGVQRYVGMRWAIDTATGVSDTNRRRHTVTADDASLWILSLVDEVDGIRWLGIPTDEIGEPKNAQAE